MIGSLPMRRQKIGRVTVDDLEFLALYVRHGYKGVAHAQGVSISAVKRRGARIRRYTGSRTMTEAVAVLIKAGYLK